MNVFPFPIIGIARTPGPSSSTSICSSTAWTARSPASVPGQHSNDGAHVEQKNTTHVRGAHRPFPLRHPDGARKAQRNPGVRPGVHELPPARAKARIQAALACGGLGLRCSRSLRMTCCPYEREGFELITAEKGNFTVTRMVRLFEVSGSPKILADRRDDGRSFPGKQSQNDANTGASGHLPEAVADHDRHRRGRCLACRCRGATVGHRSPEPSWGRRSSPRSRW